MHTLKHFLIDCLIFTGLFSGISFFINISWFVTLFRYLIVLFNHSLLILAQAISDKKDKKQLDIYSKKYNLYYELISDFAYIYVFAGLGYFVVATIIVIATITRGIHMKILLEKDKTDESSSSN